MKWSEFKAIVDAEIAKRVKEINESENEDDWISSDPEIWYIDMQGSMWDVMLDKSLGLRIG